MKIERGMEISKGDKVKITLRGNPKVEGQWLDYEGQRVIDSERLLNVTMNGNVVESYNYYTVDQSLTDESEGKFYLYLVNNYNGSMVFADEDAQSKDNKKKRSEILSITMENNLIKGVE